jgi:hypothetical protein
MIYTQTQAEEMKHKPLRNTDWQVLVYRCVAFHNKRHFGAGVSNNLLERHTKDGSLFRYWSSEHNSADFCTSLLAFIYLPGGLSNDC